MSVIDILPVKQTSSGSTPQPFPPREAKARQGDARRRREAEGKADDGDSRLANLKSARSLAPGGSAPCCPCTAKNSKPLCLRGAKRNRGVLMTLAWRFFFFPAVTTTAPSVSKRDSSILASEGAIVVKKGTLVSQERTTKRRKWRCGSRGGISTRVISARAGDASLLRTT